MKTKVITILFVDGSTARWQDGEGGIIYMRLYFFDSWCEITIQKRGEISETKKYLNANTIVKITETWEPLEAA
jgi:hypothetical protein